MTDTANVSTIANPTQSVPQQNTGVFGATPYASANPTGTTTAPSVITSQPATTAANTIQSNVTNQVTAGQQIQTAKSNLTTTYDANDNMVQTGGKLPNGSTYTNTIPKGAPGYVANPATVAHASTTNATNAATASTNAQTAALTSAAAGGVTPTANSQLGINKNLNQIEVQTGTSNGGVVDKYGNQWEKTSGGQYTLTALGGYPNNPYNSPSPTTGSGGSSVQPPTGVDPSTATGQAEWYNQDPQGYQKWATANGVSSDQQFQVQVLAGNQQLQSLQTQGNNYLQQYLSGTFPLTASQQAQVAGLQQMWQNTINAQTNANQTYVAASAMASARQGGQYDPMGSVASANRAIQTGLDRITEFQGQEQAAVNALIQGFQDNDYKAVTDNLDRQERAVQAITNNLKTVNDAIVKAKEDAQTQANYVEQKQYEQVTKPIQDVALEAAKNGASKDIQDKINSADNVQAAIAAAGDYLQSATGTLGDYLQYKRQTESKGLVPMDYVSFKDAQDKKQNQLDINKIYAQAAATASANATESDKVQQRLENQYSTKLKVLFSSRTGALGVENQKINQANHLNSLFQQFYDPKTGNYNIPSSQYQEVALGLANLVSNTGTSTEGEVNKLVAMTAKGDFNGLIQYLGGTPQNGNTQDMIKNLLGSVDRQAETAVNNRAAAFQQLSDQAPTDLDPARKSKLDQTFTDALGYTGQDRIDKGQVDQYVTSHPADAGTISQLYQVPGATDSMVLGWLKDNGYLSSDSSGASSSASSASSTSSTGSAVPFLNQLHP